ncbi:hypothetical protein LTS18_012451 [Coniosporium uncinatum]|uniref:Uncharacterized protein n=1 Tax=Coniosporium uncinatum TaxID=93489 RepID=A0ACC3DVR2_9PEZI|nr:hypothetical protein LTS18_012451 [Coniosporium uncinatum]
MNCPSRTDEDFLDTPGYNQSPPALSGDLTTRNDLNGIANSRSYRDHRIDPGDTALDDRIASELPTDTEISKSGGGGGDGRMRGGKRVEGNKGGARADVVPAPVGVDGTAVSLGGSGIMDAGMPRNRGLRPWNALWERRRGKAKDVEEREHEYGMGVLASSGSATFGPGVHDAVGENEKSGHVVGERKKQNPRGSGLGGNGYAVGGDGGSGRGGFTGKIRDTPSEVLRVLKRYTKFVGPGMMVAVAYIDPGNYATDVAAGATYEFRLLFMILLSNIFAIFLQSLCVKLGTVTGLNLAENCRAHLPPWLNYVLYFFAESAIIATDIAEVIGTAIALNVLLNVPLVAGCAISIVDVLIILFFYRPTGPMRSLRFFEFFVMLLVLGVVVCFCYQLSLIRDTPVGDVFRGYLPSSALVESKGLYQACGILGATVMPHSLYLGSGCVQARLREFDTEHRNTFTLQQVDTTNTNSSASLGSSPSSSSLSDFDAEKVTYRPSLAAIRSCMSYSIAELAISLFTFALFVNSAILIVAGASLYGGETGDRAASADLFGIHDLLSTSIAPVAGTIFALALLLSGMSAGIVCTIAGQMVSEGQLNWTVKPWVRRIITRTISILPSIVIAGAVGKEGLSAALEGSQVALSVILPFVSAPLIYFTCRNKFMTVVADDVARRQARDRGGVLAAAAGGGAAGGGVRGGVGGAEAEGEEEEVVGMDMVERERRLEQDADATGAPASGMTTAAATTTMATTTAVVKMRNGWLTAAVAVVIWGVIVVMNVALLVLVGLGVE